MDDDEKKPDASQAGDDPEDNGSESKTLNPSEREKELEKQLAEQKEKLIKAEAAIVASKKKDKVEQPEKEEDKSPTLSQADPYELAKTVSVLKDYSEDEIGYIQQYAKMNNLSPQEAAKADDVKEFIGFKREKVAKQNNIPDSSSAKASVYGKSPKDIAKMSKEDHQKLEAEVLRKKAGREGV